MLFKNKYIYNLKELLNSTSTFVYSLGCKALYNRLNDYISALTDSKLKKLTKDQFLNVKNLCDEILKTKKENAEEILGILIEKMLQILSNGYYNFELDKKLIDSQKNSNNLLCIKEYEQKSRNIQHKIDIIDEKIQNLKSEQELVIGKDKIEWMKLQKEINICNFERNDLARELKIANAELTSKIWEHNALKNKQAIDTQVNIIKNQSEVAQDIQIDTDEINLHEINNNVNKIKEASSSLENVSNSVSNSIDNAFENLLETDYFNEDELSYERALEKRISEENFTDFKDETQKFRIK